MSAAGYVDALVSRNITFGSFPTAVTHAAAFEVLTVPTAKHRTGRWKEYTHTQHVKELPNVAWAAGLNSCLCENQYEHCSKSYSSKSTWNHIDPEVLCMNKGILNSEWSETRIHKKHANNSERTEFMYEKSMLKWQGTREPNFLPWCLAKYHSYNVTILFVLMNPNAYILKWYIHISRLQNVYI